MNMENEIVFISTDVESDGPIPAIYSMLSLGSVAFRIGENGYEQLDTFEENLLEYPGAVRHPKTMRWWNDFPDAWKKIRENP